MLTRPTRARDAAACRLARADIRRRMRPGRPTRCRTAEPRTVQLTDLAAAEDCHRAQGWDGHRRDAVPVDGHAGARAVAVAEAGATDDVAVHAAGQPGAERARLRRRAVVDRDPALVAAAEGDQVRLVVPPVRDRSGTDEVVPAHHVGHSLVPVDADPGRVGTRAVGIRDLSIGGRWWRLV